MHSARLWGVSLHEVALVHEYYWLARSLRKESEQREVSRSGSQISRTWLDYATTAAYFLLQQSVGGQDTINEVHSHLYPALILAFQNTRLGITSTAHSDHPRTTRATHNTAQFSSRPHQGAAHGPLVWWRIR
jgi:hypothetical protein